METRMLPFRILAILLSMTVLFGVCRSSNKKAAGQARAYEEKKEKERNSGARQDSTILGLYLGMSRDSSEALQASLLGQGKLRKSPYGYIADIPGQPYSDARYNLLTDYYNGALYQVMLTDNYTGHGLKEARELCKFYEKKYGPADLIQEPNDTITHMSCKWVKGNREIIIMDLPTPSVTYRDYKIWEKKEAERK